METENNFKGNHRENVSSNKTPVLTRSTIMGIWVADTSTQLVKRGS